MKNIFLLLATIATTISFAQVAIGKDALSSPDVSLEFASGNKGIVLPWVTSAAAVTNAVSGTLIYDTADKKVKVKLATTWKDLSIQEGAVVTTLQDGISENSNAKVVYGANGATNTTSGILVLSDTNKAMILPKMESPHLNIKNPEAGMVAYDTLKRQLAIYNGTVWTFWKP